MTGGKRTARRCAMLSSSSKPVPSGSARSMHHAVERRGLASSSAPRHACPRSTDLDAVGSSSSRDALALRRVVLDDSTRRIVACSRASSCCDRVGRAGRASTGLSGSRRRPSRARCCVWSCAEIMCTGCGACAGRASAARAPPGRNGRAAPMSSRIALGCSCARRAPDRLAACCATTAVEVELVREVVAGLRRTRRRPRRSGASEPGA